MRRRHKILLFATPSLLVLAMPVTLFTLWVAWGISWSDTGSEPRGWYRITYETPGRGDFITFRLPDNLEREGTSRGYFKSRWPFPLYLTKRLAALPGDTVDVTREGVFINGVLWPLSAPLERDGTGRPMNVRYGSYRVRPGCFLALSDSPRGWDGRYFGELPMTSLVGRTYRIWHWTETKRNFDQVKETP